MFTSLEPAVQGAIVGSAGAILAAIIGAIGAWVTSRNRERVKRLENLVASQRRDLIKHIRNELALWHVENHSIKALVDAQGGTYDGRKREIRAELKESKGLMFSNEGEGTLTTRLQKLENE